MPLCPSHVKVSNHRDSWAVVWVLERCREFGGKAVAEQGDPIKDMARGSLPRFSYRGNPAETLRNLPEAPLASHVGSFAVLFSEVVVLITHGRVTDPREPRVAPFTGFSRWSGFSRNTLVSCMADSIEATRSLDPWSPCSPEGPGYPGVPLLPGYPGVPEEPLVPGAPGSPGGPFTPWQGSHTAAGARLWSRAGSWSEGHKGSLVKNRSRRRCPLVAAARRYTHRYTGGPRVAVEASLPLQRDTSFDVLIASFRTLRLRGADDHREEDRADRCLAARRTQSHKSNKPRNYTAETPNTPPPHERGDDMYTSGGTRGTRQVHRDRASLGANYDASLRAGSPRLPINTLIKAVLACTDMDLKPNTDLKAGFEGDSLLLLRHAGGGEAWISLSFDSTLQRSKVSLLEDPFSRSVATNT
ncbi:hypothetical protein EYF80_046797 [Liparis tanakae]|uniref:Uncharacterized protein n=1 Tax=Liparis tanakae TaxID=230148 RepID=A0A4Z2FP67_9TELE|nr:hypothetical protein EYF80_046797 [Liparis tanakae]